MLLCFVTTFTPWQKIRKKTQRNSANFRSFISQKRLPQFSWNLECEVMTLAGISTAKIVWFCKSVTELRVHENHIIFLPVNNSRVWHASFLGHTTHYHVSWYMLLSKMTHAVQHTVADKKKFTLRATEFIIISVCVSFPFLFIKHCTKRWAVSS